MIPLFHRPVRRGRVLFFFRRKESVHSSGIYSFISPSGDFSFPPFRPTARKGAVKMKAMIPKELVLKAMEVLAARSVGQSVTFSIDGTDHRGFLTLEEGYLSDKGVCLRTAVVQSGDDHLVQHFLHDAGSLSEMKDWLLDPSNADIIIESLQQLSARVAKGFI